MPTTEILYLFIDNKDALLEQFFISLPTHLKQEIDRYKIKEERLLRIASKFLLQKGLELFLPENTATLSPFKKKTGGKPIIENTNLCFSTAHSHHLCLVAFSLQGKIGIDIEYSNELDLNNFSDFLHLNEQDLLQKSADKLFTFYTIWTKKEAALKAAGKGIQHELNIVDASGEKIQVEDEYYYTRPISSFKNYTIQVAADHTIMNIELRKIIP